MKNISFSFLYKIILIAFVLSLGNACSSIDLNGGVYRSPSQNRYSKNKSKSYSNKSRYIVVKKGDTVYSIARKNQISIRNLIIENRLAPPFKLKIGDKIKLPNASIHIVKKGDTIYSISRTYQVDMSALTRINNIRAPYTISLNQELKIPSSVVEENRTHYVAKSTSKKPAKKMSFVKKVKQKVKAIQIAAPIARSKALFAWPVKGKLITKYGPVGVGRHNDGINILVEAGTKVKSAENGVVAYAGNELRGFGNLLLIKHDGGWMTAYAHNKTLLVKRGDQVKRGEEIAVAGNSGNVKKVQVHFEIRKGTKALNPEKYLE
ncbi:MAG: LysM peptidoglycan-binding domain-containing protein [Alphaproteobacteria bacterium]|nr:LysM peptidoglycan-binding domain-containing protein [Alphaproteobacteria bacterium]